MRIAFLHGVGRSGTSILGEALARHPSVAYRFEDTFWGTLGFPDRADWPVGPIDATPERCARAFAWAADRPDGTYLVEKNPRHAGRLGFLTTVWRHARLVQIVRDGRDVAVEIQGALRSCGSDGLARGTPRWGGWDVGDPSWRIDSIQYAASAWVRVMMAARPFDDRSYTIRYEDMVARPVETLRSILDHLGLERSPAVDAFTAESISDMPRYEALYQSAWTLDLERPRIGRWRDLPGDDIDAMMAIMWPLLEAHRYG